MKWNPLFASLLLVLPVLALANEAVTVDDTPTVDQGAEAETLVVHGSRAIASGYEARGTNVQRIDVDDADVLPVERRFRVRVKLFPTTGSCKAKPKAGNHKL